MSEIFDEKKKPIVEDDEFVVGDSSDVIDEDADGDE